MTSTMISDELVERINNRVDYWFREISKIPRGSGNEKAVSDFIAEFAEARRDKGITYIRSSHPPIGEKKVYDIVVRKPGFGDYNNLPVIILQAHIDMVCQKREGSPHDFTRDPIVIQVNGNKMTAEDTTLGADDGIGVACMLAILESDDVPHPPVEALFTSDEEADMTGAMAVSRELVQGTRLINIDTETEGVFYYGCAGGINANFSLPAEYKDISDKLQFFHIEVSGLLGGHSGVQIHEKHANANRLIGRTLFDLSKAFAAVGDEIHLVKIIGGDMKNAITRKASAIVGVKEKHAPLLCAKIEEAYRTFAHEYEYVETDLKLEAEPLSEKYDRALSPCTLSKLLSALMLLPNDVLAMHGGIDNLVETSCNLGVLQQKGDIICMVSFIRSFIESKKQFVVEEMRILANLIGADFTTDADFPNWEPKTDSELVSRFQDAYMDIFEKAPKFESIHAGLECGHFARAFPDMDMIACGPTITGAHTTEETLYIDTVEMIVRLLLNILERMKDPAADSAFLKQNTKSSHEEHCHLCQCIR